MSIVEDKQTFEGLSKSKTSYVLRKDSSDMTRFRILIDSAYGTMYFTAYPLEITHGRHSYRFSEGYQPKYGILFSGLEESVVRSLYASLNRITAKRFKADQLVEGMSADLKVPKGKLLTVIVGNRQEKISRVRSNSM